MGTERSFLRVKAAGADEWSYTSDSPCTFHDMLHDKPEVISILYKAKLKSSNVCLVAV
jgi:hypothetical protein